MQAMPFLAKYVILAAKFGTPSILARTHACLMQWAGVIGHPAKSTCKQSALVTCIGPMCPLILDQHEKWLCCQGIQNPPISPLFCFCTT
eukprot:444420-Pelagomonas_calceolata.AAC.4